MKSERWEGCTRLLRYLHACAESRRSHLVTRRWGSDSLAGPLISRRGWPVNAYYRGTLSSTCSTQINRVARRSRDAEQFRAPSPGGHFSHASRHVRLRSGQQARTAAQCLDQSMF